MSTSLVHRLNIFNMIGSLLLTGYLVRSSWSEPNLPMGAGTTVQTAEPVQKTRPEGYIPTVKEIFSDLEEPLLESIMQKELYPKDYLPSQELIDRAIATNSIHSKESKEVSELVIKCVYDQINILICFRSSSNC